jgi:hypothetical protein
MRQHFQVSPPSMQQMGLALERAGLISRNLGVVLVVRLRRACAKSGHCPNLYSSLTPAAERAWLTEANSLVVWLLNPFRFLYPRP